MSQCEKALFLRRVARRASQEVVKLFPAWTSHAAFQALLYKASLGFGKQHKGDKEEQLKTKKEMKKEMKKEKKEKKELKKLKKKEKKEKKKEKKLLQKAKKEVEKVARRREHCIANTHHSIAWPKMQKAVIALAERHIN
eukprot:3681981-Amphidinium_carterae.1